MAKAQDDELVMKLVELALSQPPETREAYVRAACADDAVLFSQVWEYVQWDDRMKGFLLEPLFRPLAEHRFEPGELLAERFRIVHEVGQGGMGIVYEAMDLQLDRRVALKCAKSGHGNRLPPEARAAREVSHFNVCKVHDLHKVVTEFGDLDFLSMEFVDGETLSQRMNREGPLPGREAREIALQICSGLAQAHRQGVIHGDLKCSNVILARSPEGGVRAVITDFGLAKLKFDEGSHVMSGRGGTFDYMAPELFRGEPATIASDLYALGVLFHSMLKGGAPEMVHPSLARALIEAWNPDSHASTVTIDRAIIDLDWQRKIAELPSPWKKMVTRSLAPRPENRFGSAEEVRQALMPRASWARWGVSGAAASALVLGWVLLAGNRGGRLQGLVQLTSATDLSESASLSRDGKVIAYASDRAEAGNLDIWIQPLPAGQARRLTTDSTEDNDPSVSPDGRMVAFRSERNGGGIYLVDRIGGNERLLIARGRNPQFSPDGQHIVYWTGDRNESVPSGRVYLIPTGGGIATRLAGEFEDARLPIWSSDGRFILFSGCKGSEQPLPACMDWWVARADGTTLNRTGAMSLLRQEQINPRDTLGAWRGETVAFSASRGGVDNLWELRISQRDWRAVGHPRPLTSGDASQIGVTVADDDSIAIWPAFGGTPRLAYRSRYDSGGRFLD